VPVLALEWTAAELCIGRDALGADVALDELPTLSKATLMEQFDRVVTDPRMCRAAVEAHATGNDPAALVARRCHVFSTSGTTGRRGVFPQTPDEFSQWVAAAERMTGRIGLDPGERDRNRGADAVAITQKLFTALGGFGDGRPQLNVAMPLPKLVDALNRDRPAALFTAASVAGMLAEQQLEGRLEIQPEPGYKMLVTSLVNRTLPLIRYELADTVTIAPPIDVEAVAEIAREPGGAKLKLVKSV
jgi:phenylacetate-CoA ligase